MTSNSKTGFESLSKESKDSILNSVAKSDSYQIMEELQPNNEQEFKAISGIGEVSLTKLESVIEEIESNNTKYLKSNWNPNVSKRLKFYEEKLTRITQSNNLIWNSKVVSRTLIDLTILEDKIIREIINLIDNYDSSKSINLLFNDEEIEKLVVSYSKRNKESHEQLEKRKEMKNISYFSNLIRNNKQQIVEKGRNILFASKYTIEGLVDPGNGVNLKVRAPLFLIPVDISHNLHRNGWVFKNDIKRDPMLNPFIDQFIEKSEKFVYSTELTLYENLVKFCELSKIKIIPDGDPIKFTTKSSTQKSNFRLNEFKITNNLLVGMFAGFGDPIQSEIKSLIKNKMSSEMLNEFLSNTDMHSLSIKEAANDNVKTNYNDDSNIRYTNSLNAQQLKALKLLNQDNIKGVTIWGPPGTGKSETIISIIENEISKGNTKVLLVSEKQAALEVVNNRLKDLKDHSLLISDTKNKDSFYEQLATALNNNNDMLFRESFDKNANFKQRELFDKIDLLYNQYGDGTNFLDFFRNKIYKESFKKIKGIAYDRISSIFESVDIDKDDVLEIFKIMSKLSESPLNEIKMFEELSTKYVKRNYKEILDYIDDLILKLEPKCILPKNYEEDKELIPIELNRLKGFFNLFKRKKYIKQLMFRGYKKEDLNILSDGTYFTNLEDNVKTSEEYMKSLVKEKEIIREIRVTWINAQKYDEKITKAFAELNNKNYPDNINVIKKVIIDKLLDSRDYSDIKEIIELYSEYIEEIKELEKDRKNITTAKLEDVINRRIKKASKNNRFSNIEKAINRKRKIPVKKFLQDYMLEVRQLVPIWLAQPETVPVIFDLTEKFDLVIFDEASQMFMERSIPAILRAKKVVVLGDEKQLGPSSFFAGRISTEDEDDYLLEGDESLLTYAKSKLVTVMLKNHYRSEDIGLIKFSNEKYYENSLNFINKSNRKEKSPVEYHFVEQGYYSDGINDEEANKVIEILYRLMDTNHKDTIAIITTNEKQRGLIMDKINFENQELNTWLSNNDWIIKAIENVQGDERDIVIFATTFGPDSNGVQKINFGPISNKLGSNRINVAITRAKKKMVVVSSIDLERAIEKVKNSTNQGPKDFINYIKFAKNFSQPILDQNKNYDIQIFDSPFEEEVYGSLESIMNKLGYKIITQYDTLGYKIDMVVINKDSNEIICAIECDGAKFHSSSKARERDYQRQEFLESRGWHIYRIWSTSWWKDSKAEVQKFERYINKITNKITKLNHLKNIMFNDMNKS